MQRKKKKGCKKFMGRNRKGQMGLALITGMITAVLVFVMMSAFLPTIIQMLGTTKGSNGANCVGYVDSTGYYSYNSSLQSDTITCSILNFTPGMFVLSIIFAVIAGIITGTLSMAPREQQQPYYPQYG